MITLYVDLDISTTGAAGTDLDPLGYDEFETSINTDLSDNVTYNLKGSHTYTSKLDVSVARSTSIILQAWEDTPPKIKFAHDIVSGSPEDAFGIDYANSGDLYIDRVLIQVDATVTSGSINTISAVNFSLDSNLVNIQRSFLAVNPDSEPAALSVVRGTSIGGTVVLSVAGCDIVNLSSYEGSTSESGYISCLTSDFIWTVDFSSNYFDGPADNAFYLNASGTGTMTSSDYDYNAIYNNTGMSNIAGGSLAGSITAGTHNKDNHTDASFFSSIGDILTMTLPGDIKPVHGDALANFGNPDLGIAYDLFNQTVSYDNNPDIGAVEHTPPTAATGGRYGVGGLSAYMKRF